MEADVRTIQAGNDCLPPHCSLISLKSRPAAMAEECDLSLWQVSMYSGRLGGSFPESASGRSWPGAPVGLLAPKRPYPGQARPRLTAYGRYVELKLPAKSRHPDPLLQSSHWSA